MSSFTDAREIYPKYEEKQLEDVGGGVLIIFGISFPKNEVFGLLDKIWSSVRKRIYELYSINVTGLFMYREQEKIVSCSFYLNFAGVPKEETKKYLRIFKDTFPCQMSLFEEAIESFLLDSENGYVPYCELVEKGGSAQDFHEMLNRFLRSQNLKKDGDNHKIFVNQ